MNCTIACMARSLDLEYEQVDRLFQRKALHIQEIMDFYYRRNMLMLQVELVAMVQDRHGQTHHIERPIDPYLSTIALLYLGARKVPHMCLWYPELAKSWEPTTGRYVIGIPKQTTMIFPIFDGPSNGWEDHG